MTEAHDLRTCVGSARAPWDHGTAQQAIEWALHHNPDVGAEREFLTAWQEGSARECWPDFYAWLDQQLAPQVERV